MITIFLFWLNRQMKTTGGTRRIKQSLVTPEVQTSGKHPTVFFTGKCKTSLDSCKIMGKLGIDLASIQHYFSN